MWLRLIAFFKLKHFRLEQKHFCMETFTVGERRKLRRLSPIGRCKKSYIVETDIKKITHFYAPNPAPIADNWILAFFEVDIQKCFSLLFSALFWDVHRLSILYLYYIYVFFLLFFKVEKGFRVCCASQNIVGLHNKNNKIILGSKHD